MDHVQPVLQPAVGLGATLRNYGQVAKPGIVAGNLLSLAAGFLLAAGGQVDGRLLAAVLAGTALVIAAACVLNNLLDRDLDRAMARTRERPLARGSMRPRAALWYAAALGTAGTAILLARADLLAVAVVLGGFAVYVGLYTVLLKPRSHWATVVGSLAGAAPPVAGYCAAGGRLDAGALWLALVFCVWQIAHFHAIAIRRLDDYRAAAIPVLAATHGVPVAWRQMMAFVLAFVALSQLPPGGAGLAWHGVTMVAGLGWLYAVWRGAWRVGDAAGIDAAGADGRRDGPGARRAFTGSLAALAVLSAAIIAGAW